jgi:hypothetical protein
VVAVEVDVRALAAVRIRTDDLPENLRLEHAAQHEGSAPDNGNPARAVRVSGKNFSIPLPPGYEHITRGTIADMMRAEVLDPGGVILMADATSVSGATPGTIVVSPTASDLSADAVTEDLCQQISALLAGQHDETVERAGMVELPWGQTCQWELVTAHDPDRRRIGTMFCANAEDWIVTCHADVHDDTAREACNQVLHGWAFEE